MYKKRIGEIGEEIACDYIRKRGYKVICTNFRFGRMGEIDIIAEENEYICFIEVKTRSSKEFGTGAESVDHRKQLKILRLAQVYLKQNRFSERDTRFDVVEVYVNRRGNSVKLEDINLIKNAFTG